MQQYKREDIQSGDLLIWTGDNVDGKSAIYLKLVRLLTMSDYGHVSIAWKVKDRLFHVEATQPEITFERVKDQDSFYHIPMNLNATTAQMNSFFDNKLGMKYSFADAIRAYLGMTVKRDDRWQCVELCNYFYRSMGLNLGEVYVPNRFVEAVMTKTGQPLVRHGPVTL